MTDTFHQDRRTGIGGSDTGIILNVSPWGSRLGLWQQKRGLAESDPPTERMLWGKRLEPVVLDAYIDETGHNLRQPRFTRHPEHEFVVGHVDALDAITGAVIEVKVIRNLGRDWGKPGTDQIPAYYFSQVQHYMLLHDAPEAVVVVLVGGSEMRKWNVPADPGFQAMLLDEERAFWRLVEEDTPPDPDGSDDAKKAIARAHPAPTEAAIESTAEIEDMLFAYLSHKQMRDDEVKRTEELAQQIQMFMGDHERLIGVHASASWPKVAGRIDWKAAAYDWVPDIETRQEQYRGKPSRRFTVTPEGTK